jgi:hypothetical protein
MQLHGVAASAHSHVAVKPGDRDATPRVSGLWGSGAFDFWGQTNSGLVLWYHEGAPLLPIGRHKSRDSLDCSFQLYFGIVGLGLDTKSLALRLVARHSWVGPIGLVVT